VRAVDNQLTVLDRVRIVLVATSHPGNIGAVARAMKNMRLSNLVLVTPDHFPHEEADSRASGATDLLAAAAVVGSVEEALVGCQLVIGTSARGRRLPWPVVDPAACAERVVEEAQSGDIAILFGRERTGLTNEELALCHYQLLIPTNNEYSSLNIAMSVQIVAYELFKATMQHQGSSSMPARERLATADELEGLYDHFESALQVTGFLDPANPGKLMPRLRRLFGRVRLEHGEVSILRGILRASEGPKRPRKLSN
jgi:tRNA (cytidine32/uridine32-2'-O)-methyltransferase